MSTKLNLIEIIYLPLGVIKPYWKNPRINEETIKALVETIPEIGFNVPIVVDENYVIVKGHARFGAAARLGMQELPCIISHNDDDLNRLDRIADNRVFELSQWDFSKLGSVEPKFVVGAGAKEPEELKPKQPPRKYTIVCPYCNEMVKLEL